MNMKPFGLFDIYEYFLLEMSIILLFFYEIFMIVLFGIFKNVGLKPGSPDLVLVCQRRFPENSLCLQISCQWQLNQLSKTLNPCKSSWGKWLGSRPAQHPEQLSITADWNGRYFIKQSSRVGCNEEIFVQMRSSGLTWRLNIRNNSGSPRMHLEKRSVSVHAFI